MKRLFLLLCFVPAVAFCSENIALNKPATANGTHVSSSPSYAVDGDYQTDWNRGWYIDEGTGPAWLIVDLLAPYNIDQINLTGANEEIRTIKGESYDWIGLVQKYELYGSLDGTDYDLLDSDFLVDTETIAGSTNVISVSGSYRYLKLDVLYSGLPYTQTHWVHLYEMQVFEVPEPTTLLLFGLGGLILRKK